MHSKTFKTFIEIIHHIGIYFPGPDSILRDKKEHPGLNPGGEIDRDPRIVCPIYFINNRSSNEKCIAKFSITVIVLSKNELLELIGFF